MRDAAGAEQPDTSSDAALALALAEEEEAAAAAAASAAAAAAAARPPRPPPPPWPAGASGAGAARGGAAPPAPPRGRPRPPPGFCAGCGLAVGPAGASVSALGCAWHPPCFACAVCGAPLVGRFVFTPLPPGGDGAASAALPSPCHPACHEEAFGGVHPRCWVCGLLIPTRSDGRVEFRVTPFWDDYTCPAHESDGTPCCSGCQRLERAGARHAALPDRRTLCLACLSTAVVDERDAEPLYGDVLAFFAGLGAPLPARPPLRLVSAGDLTAHLAAAAAAATAAAGDRRRGGAGGGGGGRGGGNGDDGGGNGGGSGSGSGHGASGVVRGLTLTEETVAVAVPAGAAAASFVPQPAAGGALSFRAGCSVTAILLLSSLPRLLCGSVLAHECDHALLRLRAFPRLAPRTEEGLCQLFALLWLEAAARGADAAASPGRGEGGGGWGGGGRGGDAAHAAFLAQQIRDDPGPVYGDGARDALRAYDAHGLAATLAHVRLTGCVPAP